MNQVEIESIELQKKVTLQNQSNQDNLFDICMLQYGISHTQLRSRSRENTAIPLADVRHAMMMLMCEFTSYTHSHIGTIFSRDHATINHAIKKYHKYHGNDLKYTVIYDTLKMHIVDKGILQPKIDLNKSKKYRHEIKIAKLYEYFSAVKSDKDKFMDLIYHSIKKNGFAYITGRDILDIMTEIPGHLISDEFVGQWIDPNHIKVIP